MKKSLFYFSLYIASYFFLSMFTCCQKAKYKNPTCDSNCITIHAIFTNKTQNAPFSNKNLTVKASQSTGLGMSFRKLWEMSTNENGEAFFDICYNDIVNKSGSFGGISFFIADKRYWDKGTSGNRVDMFVEETDIGKTISHEFILYRRY